MNKLSLLALLCSLLLLGSSFDFYANPGFEADVECVVSIPESISPNGDGINDWFFIKTACQYDTYSLTIKDNRKRVVFETHNPRQVWDGSENGIPLPQGYYFWDLKFKIVHNGSMVQEKGEIALIR